MVTHLSRPDHVSDRLADPPRYPPRPWRFASGGRDPATPGAYLLSRRDHGPWGPGGLLPGHAPVPRGLPGVDKHGLFLTYLAELAQRTRYKLFANFGYIVAASPFYGMC